MKNSLSYSVLPYIFVFLLFSLAASANSTADHNILQCLFHYSNTISQLIYTPKNSSYFSILNFSIQNSRFSSPFSLKPLAIITPSEVSHVQATVVCSKKHGLQVRVRSGGHDYEGLSYVSDDYIPFLMIDLINLRSIDVNVEDKTTWVQAGATVGELYYRIAEKSGTLGFPAGSAPTVGVGGQFSAGGFGTLYRKYGVASDNIIDAKLVDVEGRVLDRESLKEDLFWAIRGGGASSFGVVIAYKIRLVPVPSTVTVFTVNRTLEQNATGIVYRWQFVAEKLPEDLYIDVVLQAVNSSQEGNKTIQSSFNALFLGGLEGLLLLMQEKFPELGLSREDCVEMSWIDSVLRFAGFSSGQYSKEVLLDRTPQSRHAFKAKSDFVKKPIPEHGLEGIWKRLYEKDVGMAWLMLNPYGGKMEQIPESEIPFPHRKGNIYKIQYFIFWQEENFTLSQMHISWIRSLYRYMTPFVSKNPRATYLNFRDLDIGRNNPIGKTCYAEASIWGLKYFKSNFERLVHVKTIVDPTNFFRNEQSIPPLYWQRGD